MSSRGSIALRHWRLYISQDGLCFYCQQPMTLHHGRYRHALKRVTVDHLVPLSMGGRYGYANEVAACYSCNHERGNRDWKVFFIEKAHVRITRQRDLARPLEP